MQYRGSTPILTRNISTKFEANPCSSSRGEVEKLKKVHNDNNDGHRVIIECDSKKD